MPSLLPNVFSTYTLTKEEITNGTILNIYQLAVLQNMLAEKATARLTLRLDPTNVTAFVQEEAYLAGQIELLQEQIERSKIAELNGSN